LLSCRYGNPFLSSLLRLRREPGESIGFRALLSVRVRTWQAARRMRAKPMPSWVSASLGCSLRRASAAKPRTLTRFRGQTPIDGGRTVSDRLRPKALPAGWIGMTSLEVSDPYEVSHLPGPCGCGLSRFEPYDLAGERRSVAVLTGRLRTSGKPYRSSARSRCRCSSRC